MGSIYLSRIGDLLVQILVSLGERHVIRAAEVHA